MNWLIRLAISDEGYVMDESGHAFWGSQGSGILFVRRSTAGSEMLLIQRSGDVEEPYTWGVPGGACPPDDDLFESAVRETQEEIGRLPSYKLVGQYRWQAPNGSFTFTTFILECLDPKWKPTRFNWEVADALWVPTDEQSDEFHFGVKDMLSEVNLNEVLSLPSQSDVEHHRPQIDPSQSKSDPHTSV